MQRRGPSLPSPLLSVLPLHHRFELEAKEGDGNSPYQQGAVRHYWSSITVAQLTNMAAVCSCVPVGVSRSSSVQRCTSRANMPRPKAMLCSCKADRSSPPSP